MAIVDDTKLELPLEDDKTKPITESKEENKVESKEEDKKDGLINAPVSLIIAKSMHLVERTAFKILNDKSATEIDKTIIESAARNIIRSFETVIKGGGSKELKEDVANLIEKLKGTSLDKSLAKKAAKISSAYKSSLNPYSIEGNKMMYVDDDGDSCALTDFGTIVVDTVLVDKDKDGNNTSVSYVGYIQNEDKKIKFELPASYWGENSTKVISSIKSLAGDNIMPVVGKERFLVKASENIIQEKSTKTVTEWGMDSDLTNYFCGDYLITASGVNKDIGDRFIRSDIYTERLSFKELSEEELSTTLKVIRDDLMTFNSPNHMAFFLGHTFISPLMSMLTKVGNTAPGIIVHGRTGLGKSEMLKLCQKFFGEFNNKDITNWKGTPKSITYIGSRFRDCMFLADDLKYGSLSINGKAQVSSLCQSYADSAGSDRLRQSKGGKNSWEAEHSDEIKGALIISAEDIPNAEQSIISRFLVLEFTAEDFHEDRTKLSRCNNASTNFRGVMLDYIKWLLSHSDLKEEIMNKINDITEKIRSGFNAERLINIERVCSQLAVNYTGYILFVWYMANKGIITKEEGIRLKEEHFERCNNLIPKRFMDISDENPAEKVVEMIHQAMGSYKAYWMNTPNEYDIGQDKKDRATILGFYEDGCLYAYPEIMMKLVQDMLGGEKIPFSNKSIGQSLDDQGYLAKKSPNGKRYLKNHNGKIQRFYVFDAKTFGIEVKKDNLDILSTPDEPPSDPPKKDNEDNLVGILESNLEELQNEANNLFENENK